MMAYFKRWSSGLVSRVDSIVVRLENHEALADSAISDMSQKVARARVQLTRVKRDGESLRRRQAEAEREASLWRDRARSEPDEARALECLRRSKSIAHRQAELAQRLQSHQQTEQKLRQDVHAIEHRLERLREQRNTMRTRQTRADALQMLQDTGHGGALEIESIMERWDERIAEAEIVAGCAEEDRDAFAQQFADEEERTLLRAELQSLKQEREA